MKDGKTQLELDAASQPRTLFKPGAWITKIDFINHLILFNNVLITVLSEKEGGKTSFGSLLKNSLDPQIKPISMTVKPPCDRQDLLNDIATQLHLNNDVDTNLASIVAQINERKAHVLVVIDDAQHLPEAFIKEAMIAIKNQEDFGFFHLCLVSDYSVVATLNSLAVEPFNNLIHTIELGALNESEARTYVLQRAMASGLINKPLTDAQLKQLYRLTKGSVAKINAHLEGFIFSCSTKKTPNTLLIVKKAGLALCAAVVAGVSYLYFQTDVYKTPGRPSQLTSIQTQIDNSTERSQLVSSRQSDDVLSQIPSWRDSSTQQLVYYALPKKMNLDDMANEESEVNTVALVDKVVVIPTVKAKIEEHAAQPAVANATLESKLVTITGFNQSIKPLKKAVAQAKKSVNRYTIQLVASHKASDVHRFKKNNSLLVNTKVRHFTNSKGTWYILTLGEYASRSQAQSKARQLPASLAKLNPWVRSIG